MAYGNQEAAMRTPSVVRDASPLEAARNYAQELADRAEKLANETDERVGRIVGHRPQATSGNPPHAEQPSALADQIRSSLDRIRDAMDHTSGELARL